MWCKLVLNRRFGDTNPSHLKGSTCPRPLKMEPIGSPETSVLNQLTQRNNLEDRRIQLNGGESLRSHTVTKFVNIIMLVKYAIN
jgi:hypothetical protein